MVSYESPTSRGFIHNMNIIIQLLFRLSGINSKKVQQGILTGLCITGIGAFFYGVATIPHIVLPGMVGILTCFLAWIIICMIWTAIGNFLR